MESLIQINLSSIDKTKRKKRPQQTKISNIIGVVAAGVLILVASFYLYVTLKSQKVKQLKNDYSRIEKPFIESTKLRELSGKLNNKKQTLKKCRSERINMGEKWLELAKLTPKKIYITEIELRATDKEADAQKMTIKARAENSVDESVVLEFLHLLKKNTVFTNSFNEINLSAVYSDGDEKAFSIELLENN